MRSTLRAALPQMLLLFGFWLLLSDQYTVAFVSLGAACAGLITLVTHRIVATVLVSAGVAAPGRIRRSGWLLVYLGWMTMRIVAASIQVAYFALNPRLPFEPTFVRFRTEMQRPISRVVLAVSITLVPGTLTVHLEGDEYLVHAAIPSAADDLLSARMQNLIGRFLGEAPEPAPEVEWMPVEEPAR